MAFPKDVLTTLKERADIVEVIGERVHLQAAGADYVGLCPFHGEKTPSFRVSPTWRTYHCFGCGAGGGAIDFVMAVERLSFPEAVRALADRFGVELPGNAPRESGGRAGEVLQAAEAYYRHFLAKRPEGEVARMYLRERGFEEADWAAFGLGWAPDGWQGLLNFGQSKGFGTEDLLASGLVRRSESGRMYDMLRKRVVFPIRDERGRPIAFGGRVIDALDNPKYLNTPETRLYRKSRVLFGLAQGLPALRESGRAILVEGYLDVLRMHQAGFAEAVATCGTALTEEHLKLLGRHAKRVLLLFDGDDAGVKAALRSAPLFLNAALEARVVLLPDKLDPDDYLRRHPPDALGGLLADATPLLEFLVFQLDRRHGHSVTGRQQTLEALAPVLSEIRTATARDLTVRFVADLLGMGADAVMSLARPARKDSKVPDAVSIRPARREGRHQRRVLRLLLERAELVTSARGLLSSEELSEQPLRALYEWLLARPETELAALTPDAVMEREPELAPLVRTLLLDEGLHLSAVSDAARQLENEALCVKEESKAELLRRFRAAAGSAEEELALRRYKKVRDELARLKEGFRSTHPPRPELTLRPPPKAV